MRYLQHILTVLLVLGTLLAAGIATAQTPPPPPPAVSTTYPCSYFFNPVGLNEPFPYCGDTQKTSYCYPNAQDQDPPLSSCAPGGLISTVMTEVKDQIAKLGQFLFNNIVQSAEFKTAANLALVLYLMIYGTMIWFNMASYSSAEVIKRVMKLGLVITIIAPTGTGWGFMFQNFGNFFVQGMDYLINTFNDPNIWTAANGNISPQAANLGVALPGVPGTTNMAQIPLCNIDNIFSRVFSRHFLMMTAAMLFTGPYGFICTFFLVVGIVFFTLAIVSAVVTYVRSLVGLYFLFGVAPLFICFSLFGRTRGMFKAWLEQVVSFFLQPVFVFAFLAFFISVIGNTATAILSPGNVSVPYCFAPFFYIDTFKIFHLSWFRAAVHAAKGTAAFYMYAGDVNSNGPVNGNNTLGQASFQGGGPLPIDTDALFLFVLWGFLAWRYVDMVIDIVKNLTDNTLNLITTPKSIGHWYRSKIRS